MAAFVHLRQTQIRLDIPSLTILLSQVILVVITALLAAREGTLRNRRFWLIALPLAIFLLVAGLSRFWSVVPASTVKRVWFLAAVTLGGVWIGTQFRRREILLLYELLSVMLILGSYGLILKYPKFATGPDYDQFLMWTGMLKYKGYAGSVMAFAATVFLLRLSEWSSLRWPRRAFEVTFLGLAVLMVYKSNSATSQFGLLASAAALLLGLAWIRWRDAMGSRHYRAIAAGIAGALLLGLLALPRLLALLGREITFTGRLPLWRALLSEVAARPLLGWGFGDAFWLSDHVQRVWQVIAWKPGTAHSGFVEILLDTGLVGFAAVLALLGATAVLSARYLRRHPSRDSLFLPMWLVLVVLVNVGENLLATYELFFWLALVVMFAHAAKDFAGASIGLPSAAMSADRSPS
jgi:exopolysaccharide production protein ExoQ